jgi:hypothetical protein
MRTGLTLEEILKNVTEPTNWANPEYLIEAIKGRPSLRGMVYGYVAELEFARHLRGCLVLLIK